MTTAQVTTRPYGRQSEEVFHAAHGLVGEISGSDDLWLAYPTGARFGTYTFTSREHAIEACVSYARHGWWRNETHRRH